MQNVVRRQIELGAEKVVAEPLGGDVLTAGIVFLTVRTGQAEMIAGLENGADDFLTKPVSEGELLARMKSSSRVLKLERD